MLLLITVTDSEQNIKKNSLKALESNQKVLEAEAREDDSWKKESSSFSSIPGQLGEKNKVGVWAWWKGEGTVAHGSTLGPKY